MSGERRRLVLVMADVDADHEEEFNRWYDEEHLPERKDCPGFLSARRFVSVEGEPKYLTVYELEDPEVLASDAFRAIEQPSQWQRRLAPHLSRVSRTVYREITVDVPEDRRVRAVRNVVDREVTATTARPSVEEVSE
jgi:hypothetical protein